MKTFKLLAFIFPLLLLFGGSALLLLGQSFVDTAAAETSALNGGQVLGVVDAPDGYPLPVGTVVRLFDPTVTEVRGLAFPDLNTGAFSLGPVANGLYVVKAVPPEASGLTQSLPVQVLVANSAADAGSLNLTMPQVTGTVEDPEVNPTLAEVGVWLPDGQIFQKITALKGQFAVGGLPVGSYRLQAAPIGVEPFWRSLPTVITITETSPAVPQVIDLALRPADAWGVVLSSFNLPVPGARVVFANAAGQMQSVITGLGGNWAVGGLPAGDYQVTILPPDVNSGLVAPDPQTIALPNSDSPYVLKFLAPAKGLSGVVTAQTEPTQPVFHAQVVARQVNRPGLQTALTDVNGAYLMNLGPGLWAVTVRPYSDTLPVEWVYPNPPTLVYFQNTSLPEQSTLDFNVLVADASLQGTVTLPDGSTPPFTVTVGLHNGEGVGRQVLADPADGSFEIEIPNGAYKFVLRIFSDAYLPPALPEVLLAPGEELDLGTIALLPRDAVITGTLTSDAGLPLAGVPLTAWRPGIPGTLRTLSGAGGEFALAVSAGEWHVLPAPAPSQPYLYQGDSAVVTLAAGEVVGEVNFELQTASARIHGVLVNVDSGSPASEASGWASALSSPDAPRDGGIVNGAPIVEGVFDIFVPGGSYSVFAYLPAGSPYMSTEEGQVSVQAGETTTVTLLVTPKTALISGALRDFRAPGEPVTGVNGVVYASSGENWAAGPINPATGAYRLQVAGGLWLLNYRIDERLYTRLGGPLITAVEDDEVQLVNLPVARKDSSLQGVVLDPNGDPLPGAAVVVRGVDPALKETWFHTRTRSDGTFSLPVPHGLYRLGAAGGDPAWLNPVEIEVYAPLPTQFAQLHQLQFRLPDAAVEGSLLVTPTQTGGMVWVTAWSDDGGYVQGLFPVEPAPEGGSAAGTFNLDVSGSTIWHVRAIFETNQYYWIARSDVETQSGITHPVDLVLSGPQFKPAPRVVTFDAAEPQRILLADGTSIYIPAGAMPAEGLVTLRIVPLAGLPQQQHATVFEYGYAFLASDASGQPIEANFNQDVVITFQYHEAALNGISELWLKPAYFSTTTNRWTFPSSYVVDSEANTITIQIDHFTDYALTTVPVTRVYIPLLTQ